jgi:hypothetical protein
MGHQLEHCSSARGGLLLVAKILFMSLEQLLLQLGVSISANAVYDFIKTKSFNSADEASSELNSKLDINNAEISGKIINFLAQNGDIKIEGSNIYGENTVKMASSANTKLSFGNNSTSKTKNTSIEAGQGATIEMQGGANIVQEDDGSISFRV